MKILVAYDGSGHSRTSLVDLQYAGLPAKAESLIVSVAERWMPPTAQHGDIEAIPDSDVAEYLQRCNEQADRKLAETKEIALDAKETLHRDFPQWAQCSLLSPSWGYGEEDFDSPFSSLPLRLD